MFTNIPTKKIEEVALERINFMLKTEFPDYMFQKMNLSSYIEPLTGNIVSAFTTHFYGTKKYKVIKYPLNWVQAIKERFFPKWLKLYSPIKYAEIQVETLRICPHINTQSEYEHIRFVINGGNK